MEIRKDTDKQVKNDKSDMSDKSDKSNNTNNTNLTDSSAQKTYSNVDDQLKSINKYFNNQIIPNTNPEFDQVRTSYFKVLGCYRSY